MEILMCGNVSVMLTQKRVKHLYLRVDAITGEVKVTAPRRMSLKTIETYVDSKTEWIREQQNKFNTQIVERAKEYVEGEVHHFNGKKFYLKIEEHSAVSQVRLLDEYLVLSVPPYTSKLRKKVILEAWYHQQLHEKINELMTFWTTRMNLSVTRWSLRKMKTQWGSCSSIVGTIRFSLSLAKQPLECIEYVVVHELAHLIEASHNHRFKAIMDHYLPSWRLLRAKLNELSSL